MTKEEVLQQRIKHCLTSNTPADIRYGRYDTENIILPAMSEWSSLENKALQERVKELEGALEKICLYSDIPIHAQLIASEALNPPSAQSPGS